MEDLFGCLFVFFLIFIIAIFTLSSISSKQRAIQAVWKKFAVDSGLDITFERQVPFPKITGKYREFDYVLETVMKGTGEESIIYTVITIKLPERSAYNFHIYRKNFFFNKIEKIFGSKDIQTGNIRFDDVFMIKISPDDKINEVFTPDLQRKLLYGSYLINMTLSETKLQNKTKRIIDSTQDLLYLSEIMVEIALNFSGKDIILQERNDPVLAEEKKRNALAQAQEERIKAIARAEEEAINALAQVEEDRIKTLSELEEKKIKSLAQAEEDRIKVLSELEERTLKALTQVEENRIKSLAQSKEETLKTLTQVEEKKQLKETERKKSSDKSYNKEKKDSEKETPHKIFPVVSDFTDDFTDYSHKSSGEKQCPCCGTTSPAENKYCIDCGREI
ncbi:MAG: hypothetical protein ABRQ38_29470 [Candidatus Eremiobacterota bacterium]